jgi:hypothetical protein
MLNSKLQISNSKSKPKYQFFWNFDIPLIPPWREILKFELKEFVLYLCPSCNAEDSSGTESQNQ